MFSIKSLMSSFGITSEQLAPTQVWPTTQNLSDLANKVTTYCCSYLPSASPISESSSSVVRNVDTAIFNDLVICSKEMQKPGSIELFANQLSDHSKEFMKDSNFDLMKSIPMVDLDIEDLPTVGEEEYPSFAAFNRNSPDEKVIFSNRSCSNFELRGQLLKEDLNRFKELEPKANLYSALEQICKKAQAAQVRLYALKPLKHDESVNFTAIEKTVDALVLKLKAGQEIDSAMAKQIYEELLKG